MILYYSGTGNSKHIAVKLSEALNDELISLNDKIKLNDTSSLDINGRLIIVTPTYGWRIPRIVEDWIMKTELKGTDKVWFIMDAGDSIGNASEYNKALSVKKQLKYMGTFELKMPENYIALFKSPSNENAKRIINVADGRVNRAASFISDDKEFPLKKVLLLDRFFSSAVNPIFYKLIIKAKKFKASDDCISCSLCVKKCPLNNIVLENGRPKWGDECTHCMACICYCPKEAIEYGKKSVGKNKYAFEKLDL